MRKEWGFSAKIDRGILRRCHKVYFYRIINQTTDNLGILQVLKCPEIVEVPEYSEIPSDAGFLFSDSELTYLMDQMWDIGIRPTAGHGSTGQLAAVENHLKSVSATHDRLLTLIEKGWGTK